MASRMERYYKEELTSPGRSSRNKSLYDEIDNLGNYTNIEGVATIEKTNEIDISKVKEMLKTREQYKKQKQFKDILKEEKEILEEKPITSEEPRNYDIRDILSKARTKETSNKQSQPLNESQYEFLKSLNSKTSNYDINKEEEELKELINTIASTKLLKEESDDVGLLDDLKSDTMVGDAASIKKIIEEEKVQEEKLENTSTEIDKSFYTSSFGFTKKDFEELKNMNKEIKNNNKFIVILLIAIIAIVALMFVYFFILNK